MAGGTLFFSVAFSVRFPGPVCAHRTAEGSAGIPPAVSYSAWTIVAYTLIRQVEGHLIAPLISREMVYIPPLGIVAIATLFGRYAAIFAAPVAVIIFGAVKKLYIRDSLGDPTPIPGETPHGPAHAGHSGRTDSNGVGQRIYAARP